MDLNIHCLLLLRQISINPTFYGLMWILTTYSSAAFRPNTWPQKYHSAVMRNITLSVVMRLQRYFFPQSNFNKFRKRCFPFKYHLAHLFALKPNVPFQMIHFKEKKRNNFAKKRKKTYSQFEWFCHKIASIIPHFVIDSMKLWKKNGVKNPTKAEN